jgi:hypothetical protein
MLLIITESYRWVKELQELQNPADHASQIFSLGMGQIDRVINRVPHPA